MYSRWWQRLASSVGGCEQAGVCVCVCGTMIKTNVFGTICDDEVRWGCDWLLAADGAGDRSLATSLVAATGWCATTTVEQFLKKMGWWVGVERGVGGVVGGEVRLTVLAVAKRERESGGAGAGLGTWGSTAIEGVGGARDHGRAAAAAAEERRMRSSNIPWPWARMGVQQREDCDRPTQHEEQQFLL